MSSTQLLPDVERLAIAYLKLDPATDLLVNERVYAEPFDRVTWPFLTVRRIGGRAATHHWIDTAQLEVAGWSYDRTGFSGRQEARLICETAIAALHDMPDIDVDALAVVLSVQDVGGPRSVPDPVTGRPRWLGEVFITVHPTPDAS